MDEILLTGGRTTEGVMRRGEFVLRPLCENSGFVHKILLFLEQKGLHIAPRFYEIEEGRREKTEFLEGWCPADLGFFTDEQIVAAAKLIRQMHEALADFPGCEGERTVCHMDLSPCNFIFTENVPRFIIDWDAAVIGDPLGDLAYAAWLWLDIGNTEISAEETARRLQLILGAYGFAGEKNRFWDAVEGQMKRIARCVFKNETQQANTRAWAQRSLQFFRTHRAFFDAYTPE